MHDQLLTASWGCRGRTVRHLPHLLDAMGHDGFPLAGGALASAGQVAGWSIRSPGPGNVTTESTVGSLRGDVGNVRVIDAAIRLRHRLSCVAA
jgi:hypothetical protein